MVLKQEEVRKISKGMKKFQGFRDENCEILRSTSSGGRELKDETTAKTWDRRESTSSGGRELKVKFSRKLRNWKKVDLLRRS